MKKGERLAGAHKGWVCEKGPARHQHVFATKSHLFPHFTPFFTCKSMKMGAILQTTKKTGKTTKNYEKQLIASKFLQNPIFNKNSINNGD